jgi:hypothetical protein
MLAAPIERLTSAVLAMDEVAAGLAICPDGLQINRDAAEGAVLTCEIVSNSDPTPEST